MLFVFSEGEVRSTAVCGNTLDVYYSLSLFGDIDYIFRTAPKETLKKYGLKQGVEIVELGPGKMRESGASEGFIILYVNDKPVKSPEEIIEIAKASKRAVFIEGVTASGRTGYFAFGI